MNEYLIAAIAIVLVILLYIIIKQRIKAKQNQVETLSSDEVVEDIYEVLADKETQVEVESKKEEPQEVEEVQEEPTKEPEPQEETHYQAPQETQEEVVEEETPIVKKDLKKRELKQHGKITKENLKEFAGIKVLVAEDNIINQKVIAGLLAESGIEIVFANDGLEAINFLNNQQDFDLVLMDANMPNMDGLEATRKIKSHPDFQNIPIIALSGDIAADDIKRMLNAGMDDHLEKPLKIEALYEILYQYTEPKAPEVPLDLDIQKGIEISTDEGFYKEILTEFLQNYAQAHTQIVSALKQSDTKTADKLLLDIMGIAANIGANNVHKEATSLKQALATNPKPQKEVEAFYHAFDKLIKAIKNYLA